MIPAIELANAIVDAAAADTAYLAAATAMKVFPVVSNFVPSRSLDIGDLTLATFTGGGAKLAGTGAQDVFHDPLTAMRTIQIKSPAGGWTWECTAAPAEPETVYGFIVTDNAGAVLIGSGLLPTPVQIADVDDGFSVPYIRLAFNNSSPA